MKDNRAGPLLVSGAHAKEGGATLAELAQKARRMIMAQASEKERMRFGHDKVRRKGRPALVTQLFPRRLRGLVLRITHVGEGQQARRIQKDPVGMGWEQGDTHDCRGEYASARYSSFFEASVGGASCAEPTSCHRASARLSGRPRRERFFGADGAGIRMARISLPRLTGRGI